MRIFNNRWFQPRSPEDFKPFAKTEKIEEEVMSKPVQKGTIQKATFGAG